MTEPRRIGRISPRVRIVLSASGYLYLTNDINLNYADNIREWFITKGLWSAMSRRKNTRINAAI